MHFIWVKKKKKKTLLGFTNIKENWEKEKKRKQMMCSLCGVSRLPDVYSLSFVNFTCVCVCVVRWDCIYRSDDGIDLRPLSPLTMTWNQTSKKTKRKEWDAFKCFVTYHTTEFSLKIFQIKYQNFFFFSIKIWYEN
jgi:hypothetical protein